jgi:sugar phosphate isomerase/epimerase
MAASGLLAAALPRGAGAAHAALPVGIQLYTVNAPLQADPIGTLKALRSIGYRVIETAGFAGLSATEFRKLLDDAGLTCPSAHLNFTKGEYGPLFDDAHALGAKYVTSSVLRPGSGALPEAGARPQSELESLRVMTLDDAKQTAALANRIGKLAKQAGLQYTYHNHFFELVDQGKGQVAYDILLQETDPELVAFEIDCGWMSVAGYDPIHYFHKYPGRFPMIHVKDFMAADRAGTPAPMLRVGTELGHGVIDYKPILAAARHAGLKYYFAEQEPPFTHMGEMAAAKVSYGYLRGIG